MAPESCSFTESIIFMLAQTKKKKRKKRFLAFQALKCKEGLDNDSTVLFS